MKKNIFPLLLFLTFSNSLNAEIDPKVHDICKSVKDYKGCVELRTKNKVDSESRQWVRKDGSLSVFNPAALLAIKVKGEYGRYITFRYFRDKKGRKYEMTVEADCQDYTANWKDDGRGWLNLRSKKWSRLEPPQEAKKILDEFCPQMTKLVKDAKSGSTKYFEYPPSSAVVVKKSNPGVPHIPFVDPGQQTSIPQQPPYKPPTYKIPSSTIEPYRNTYSDPYRNPYSNPYSTY